MVKMANWDEKRYQEWRRSRGFAADQPDEPTMVSEFISENAARFDAPPPGQLPPAPDPEAVAAGAAMTGQASINDMRKSNFFGRDLATRMNLEADLANPDLQVVNRMAGRAGNYGRGHEWAAWGTLRKPDGISGTPSDATAGPAMSGTPPGSMPPASSAMSGPPPRPPAEAPAGAMPGELLAGEPVGARSPSNVMSSLSGLPAQDRIALSMLRGSRDTESIRRFNKVASKYGMEQIPTTPSKADRRRQASMGGDWVPNGQGGMGNRMTGDVNAPPVEPQPVKERLVQDGTGRWFDPQTGQYVTPAGPPKLEARGDGTFLDPATNRIVGEPVKPKLEARGDGTFLDPATNRVVGEPTGEARYKPAGVPGMMFDTVLGENVGKDLRPIKDLVIKQGSRMYNGNTGEEIVMAGGQNIRDKYQGTVVKMTTAKIEVPELDRTGKPKMDNSGKPVLKEERPEIGMIGIWNNETERYDIKPVKINQDLGGGYMIRDQADYSGLPEFKDERPYEAATVTAPEAKPAAPAGGKAPIGTVVTDGSGKKMRKVAEGKWEPVA